jgi:hypothetical protein
MRMNQLTKQLDLHFVTKRPLMLRGPAGVGKTAIVKAYAAAKGVKVFEYRIAYCEPGDLKGLCDPKDGMMTFLRPDDLPRETDVNAILFLDEVNRGSMSVMNCVMQATDGSARIGSHKLPPGCLVIAAVNGDSGYNVNSMDPALRSRFAIIDVEYDRTCLLDYAKAAGWHPRTLNYLSDMEHAGLIDSTSHHLETSIGLLGPNIGREYHAYANGEQPITLAELFSADGVARAKRLSAPDNLRADLLGVTNGEIVAFYAKQAPASLVASEHEAIVNYLQVLPADLAVGVLKTVCTARPEYTDKFQAETKLMRRLGERLTKTEGA